MAGTTRHALAAEADVAPELAAGGAGSVMLAVVPWDDPDAAALRAEQQAEIAQRYDGQADVVAHPPGELMVATVLVTVDGEPAGCGSVRRADEYALAGESTGELKRCYVRPQHRRRGIARRLLAELERLAAEAGLERLVLETGTRQHEAIALYRSAGYRRIPDFGPYAGLDDSLCLARWLRPGLTTRALVLSGALGAGKTTVAAAVGERLAERGVPHAVLDVDALCQVSPRPADDPFAQRVALAGLAALAPAWAAHGVRHVVLARVVEHPDERADYEIALGGADVAVVRVAAPEATRRDRLAARGATGDALAWELARTAELEVVLAAAGADDAVVENDGRALADVADDVLRAAGW